ncbi:SAM-dependent methyltransferase [Nocardiopsis coralliicola]
MNDGSAPAGVDTTVPSSARLYDYYLGGKNNYEVDRAAAERILAAVPELRMAARANRAFLRRAVEAMCAEGVDQFIDVGAGLPAEGPVHEVARRHLPDARVVYVDHDPAVRAHADALLVDRPDSTAAVQADLRDPDAVFADRELRERIDLSRPVGLLLIAVLHFIKDEEQPYALVERYLEHLPPGSFLVISHLEKDSQPERARFLEQMYESTSSPGQIRTQAEVRRFFDRAALLDPGVVHLADWRPREGEPRYGSDQVWAVGGVGRLDG